MEHSQPRSGDRFFRRYAAHLLGDINTTAFRTCEWIRPGGPRECSPGREAGDKITERSEPRRGVRFLVRGSYTPPGLNLLALKTPAWRPGLHSVAPPALNSFTPSSAVATSWRRSAAGSDHSELLRIRNFRLILNSSSSGVLNRPGCNFSLTNLERKFGDAIA